MRFCGFAVWSVPLYARSSKAFNFFANPSVETKFARSTKPPSTSSLPNWALLAHFRRPARIGVVPRHEDGEPRLPCRAKGRAISDPIFRSNIRRMSWWWCWRKHDSHHGKAVCPHEDCGEASGTQACHQHCRDKLWKATVGRA